MTIQLVGIAILYIIGWLPTVLTQLVQLYLNHSFLAEQPESILFTIYFIPLLPPCVCLRTIPHLMKRLCSLIDQNPQKIDAIQMRQTETSNCPINTWENINEK